jgi:hypothetical protein
MAVVYELDVHLQATAQFEEPIPRSRTNGDLETRGLLGHGVSVVGDGH